jgi:hypothetical protein
VRRGSQPGSVYLRDHGHLLFASMEHLQKEKTHELELYRQVVGKLSLSLPDLETEGGVEAKKIGQLMRP